MNGPGSVAGGAELFRLSRRGVVLTPNLSDPYEAGGVLNPAALLHAGTTYLYYRAVALQPQNYSRILIATSRLLPSGAIEVTRLNKVALEPEAFYEKWADGRGGGVEDPRITRLDGVDYMTYTAYGTVDGETAPRIALARSTNLFAWERLGLIRYSPLDVISHGRPLTFDLNRVPNKDALLFPEQIGGRYGLIHRPMFSPSTGLPHSIWLSWSTDLVNWTDHQLVLAPELPWERLKVGGGTPPIRTEQGWLTFYHGVEGWGDGDPNRRYHAGVLLLDLDEPGKVLYRSLRPVLSPEADIEKTGVVSNVVFPCGVVAQPDGQLEVYYGMADRAIGLATTRLNGANDSDRVT